MVVLLQRLQWKLLLQIVSINFCFRLSTQYCYKKTNEILKYLEAHQYVYIVTPCFFTRNKENKTTLILSFLLTVCWLDNIVKSTCFLQMAVRCNLKGWPWSIVKLPNQPPKYLIIVPQQVRWLVRQTGRDEIWERWDSLWAGRNYYIIFVAVQQYRV